MSKAKIKTINLGDAFDLQAGGGTVNWTTERDATTADVLSNRNPSVGDSFIEMGVQFNTARGNAWAVKRMWLGFDTSGITIPPASAEISISVGNNSFGIGSNPVNLATDHKFTLAAVKGHNLNQRDVDTFSSPIRSRASNVFGTGAGNVSFFGESGIAGWSSGASWASSYVSYSDLKNVSLFNSSTTEDVVTFTLNQQARLDIATCDHFYVCVIDYTYDLLNVDPSTGSPSAGAASSYEIAIPNNTFSSRGINNVIPKLTLTIGGTKDEPPTKERIEKDFTLNTFEDITAQRTRFTKGGAIVDQVPFLLGTKGPLSLRGREFSDDGKPISTTVKPPNTSKS